MATTLSDFSPQSFGLLRDATEEDGLESAPESAQTTRIEIASKEDLERQKAVRVIETWWSSVRDRRVFHLLKQAICASEYSLTQEIMRKIAPAEAELLGDPSIQAKIKFRFSGEAFPPFVVFKIFTSMGSREGSRDRSCTSGKGSRERGREIADNGPKHASSSDGRSGIKYISGRRMIRPDSEAAADARRQMGNRKFCDQVLEDICQNQQFKITDEVDITTMKDYMQYMSNMDETPAYRGGRENAWRRIDLTSLARHAPLHSLLEFLDRSTHGGHGRDTSTVRSLALSPPHHQQLERLKLLSSSLGGEAPQPAPPLWPHPTPPSRAGLLGSGGAGEAQRRSRQAKRRADKMRKMYKEGGGECKKGEGLATPISGTEEWEDDIDNLYEWTQKLSFDDIR